jgi:hypothetical protein
LTQSFAAQIKNFDQICSALEHKERSTPLAIKRGSQFIGAGGSLSA